MGNKNKKKKLIAFASLIVLLGVTILTTFSSEDLQGARRNKREPRVSPTVNTQQDNGQKDEMNQEIEKKIKAMVNAGMNEKEARKIIADQLERQKKNESTITTPATHNTSGTTASVTTTTTPTTATAPTVNIGAVGTTQYIPPTTPTTSANTGTTGAINNSTTSTAATPSFFPGGTSITNNSAGSFSTISSSNGLTTAGTTATPINTFGINGTTSTNTSTGTQFGQVGIGLAYAHLDIQPVHEYWANQPIPTRYQACSQDANSQGYMEYAQWEFDVDGATLDLDPLPFKLQLHSGNTIMAQDFILYLSTDEAVNNIITQKSKHATTQEFTIDLNQNLTPGTYYLTLKSKPWGSIAEATEYPTKISFGGSTGAIHGQFIENNNTQTLSMHPSINTLTIGGYASTGQVETNIRGLVAQNQCPY